MNVLEIEQLRKNLPHLKLDIATMTVAEGEFAILLGRLKSGKATLLKLILNMLFPDFGTICVFGLDSKQNSEAIKQQLGLVLRRPGLLDSAKLSRLKNMIRPFYSNWQEKTYRTYLRLFELDENLSYGYLDNAAKKQFTLTLALAHQPRLLLLEEPFLHFSAEIKECVAKTLWQEQQKNGLSILFTTSSPEEAASLANTIHIMHNGSLLLSLPVAQLPDYSASLNWQELKRHSTEKKPAQKISQIQALFNHYTQAEEEKV